jgi:hypothetical protein
MRTSLKFHAIAIAAIVVVITLLYAVIGSKKPSQAPTVASDRAVEVYSATWGEECNQSIQQVMEERKLTPIEKDKNGVVIERTPLSLVQQNNVLERVSQLCNGRLTCTITPTSKNLGVEPLASCAKKLNLSYRCYNYDRLWNLTIGQGAITVIDCNEAKTPAQSTSSAQ